MPVEVIHVLEEGMELRISDEPVISIEEIRIDGSVEYMYDIESYSRQEDGRVVEEVFDFFTEGQVIQHLLNGTLYDIDNPNENYIRFADDLYADPNY